MSWADESKQSENLRQGVEEVDNLRNEEQQQSLAEVSQDPHDRKRHPSEITVSVAHKDLRWIPVPPQQAQCDGQKRNDEKHGEQMIIVIRSGEFDQIVDEYTHSDDE